VNSRSSFAISGARPELVRFLAALCIRDEDRGTTPLELTAGRTYVRLRRGSYGDAERRSWQRRLGSWAEEGIEVFAFLKHEDDPQAALVALEFARGMAA
jgi:hypothetical protein